MRLASGVDLIDIERVRQAIMRHGERFLSRVFTAGERAACSERIESLAVRFAAKEAVAKALGTGIGVVGWQEIEIGYGPANQPLLQLHGKAAELAAEQGLQLWSISLSHSSDQAIAFVVALGDE